jgi:hypothetical protein
MICTVRCKNRFSSKKTHDHMVVVFWPESYCYHLFKGEQTQTGRRRNLILILSTEHRWASTVRFGTRGERTMRPTVVRLLGGVVEIHPFKLSNTTAPPTLLRDPASDQSTVRPC